MFKPVFRLSKGGFISAGLFLLVVLAVFSWVIYSSSTNPGDSGESGILLLPLAMPWIMIMPQSWLGPIAGFGSILLNGIMIYLIFGGLRFSKNP